MNPAPYALPSCVMFPLAPICPPTLATPQVSRHFEVTVFTASQRAYAERLLNIVDGQRRWIHHRLYRDACLCVEGNFLKASAAPRSPCPPVRPRDSRPCACLVQDLNVLGRELSRVILIDNSPHAFGYQAFPPLHFLVMGSAHCLRLRMEFRSRAGLKIRMTARFSHAPLTALTHVPLQLLKLLPFLEHVRTLPDVRPALRSQFQLHKLGKPPLLLPMPLTSLVIVESAKRGRR